MNDEIARLPHARALAKQRESARNLLKGAADKLRANPREATSLAEAALEAARLLGDLPLCGEAALVLANCHSKRGELTKANELIEQSLDAFERAGKHNRMSGAYKLQTIVFSSQERVSLALAAAAKALACPDLLPKDRAYLFGVIGSCFARLFDLRTALEVVEQRALPEADRSGDPSSIVTAHVFAAELLHLLAFWSAAIPDYCTVGMARPNDLASPEEYRQRAARYLDICEPHIDNQQAFTVVNFYACKANVAALKGGFAAAEPILAQGYCAVNDQFPRTRSFLMTTEAVIARVDARWQHALSVLIEVQRQPTAKIEELQRVIQHELALVYRALGRPEEALQALQTFTELQARMARLATSWIDGPSKRRYGEKLDIAQLKAAVLNPPEPAALKRAIQYIDDHLDRRLALSELAKNTGVSARTVHTLFKEFRGTSASAYVRERRLQRAHQLLSERKTAVSAVTDAIGYSNSANFARDFRKRFGRTPSDVQRASDRAGAPVTKR